MLLPWSSSSSECKHRSGDSSQETDEKDLLIERGKREVLDCFRSLRWREGGRKTPRLDTSGVSNCNLNLAGCWGSFRGTGAKRKNSRQAPDNGRVDDASTNSGAGAPEYSLREQSDAEYAQLKSSLWRSTQTVSIVGSAYAFLALTPATGIAYGWGALFGWVYWGRLVERADSLGRQQDSNQRQLSLPKVSPSLLANPAELGR